MTWLALATAVVLLLLSAVLRSGGASLVRTSRADALHDAADGDERAAIVAELLVDRTGLQPAIGLVHSGLLIVTTLLATWLLSIRIDEGWLLASSLVAAAVLLLFLADVLPRTIGRRRPRTLAYRYARLLRWAASFGAAATDLGEDEDEGDARPGVQFDGHDRDEDDRKEIELISSVLEFSDTLVREVMVPRTDMVTVAASVTSDEALDAVIEHGYSRVPVIGGSSDDILGFVYAKDLLKLMDEGSDAISVQQLMRQAVFVPETKRVSDLLREMQATQHHIAVVTDEYGGTAGIVTIEDLLEELVGEIVDEYDTPEEFVIAGPNGELHVDARLPVEDLSELVGDELPDEEWDTVGGLMLGLAGRVPKEGEAFMIGDLTLTCLAVQGRRVLRVGVHRTGVALSAE